MACRTFIIHINNIHPIRSTMNPSEGKLYHFWNHGHIGDNLLNLRFFLSISKVLQEHNIKINYYYNNDWHHNKLETMLPYVNSEIVSLKPLAEKPPNAVMLWMGPDINGISHTNNMERFFDIFYRRILQVMNIDSPSINANIWLEEPYLDAVYNKLDDKYKDIDVLILNNVGSSSQYDDNTKLNALAVYLNEHFNIVTSVQVNDTIKTAASLSLMEIGAMSTHAKYIISSCSSPGVACYNTATKKNVRKWFFITTFPGRTYSCYSIDAAYSTNGDTAIIKEYFDSLINTSST